MIRARFLVPFLALPLPSSLSLSKLLRSICCGFVKLKIELRKIIHTFRAIPTYKLFITDCYYSSCYHYQYCHSYLLMILSVKAMLSVTFFELQSVNEQSNACFVHNPVVPNQGWGRIYKEGHRQWPRFSILPQTRAPKDC